MSTQSSRVLGAGSCCSDACCRVSKRQAVAMRLAPRPFNAEQCHTCVEDWMRQRQWLRRRRPQPPPALSAHVCSHGRLDRGRGFWYLGAPGTQGPHSFEFKLQPALDSKSRVPVCDAWPCVASMTAPGRAGRLYNEQVLGSGIMPCRVGRCAGWYGRRVGMTCGFALCFLAAQDSSVAAS